jgi:hypothetical protein
MIDTRYELRTSSRPSEWFDSSLDKGHTTATSDPSALVRVLDDVQNSANAVCSVRVNYDTNPWTQLALQELFPPGFAGAAARRPITTRDGIMNAAILGFEERHDSSSGGSDAPSTDGMNPRLQPPSANRSCGTPNTDRLVDRRMLVDRRFDLGVSRRSRHPEGSVPSTDPRRM